MSTDSGPSSTTTPDHLEAAGQRPGGRPGISARGIGVMVGDKALLHGVDLDVAPGELCAVIGASGSGKSTLLRTLAGVTLPDAGHVSVDGAPAIQRTDLVGYVPFGDLVHPQLTVREALRYAAALRLPAASPEQQDARVAQVIAELRMERHADSFVGSLSDGERRRVACGSELVGQPRALVLDEPTTGLDPDLQRRLMVFLRGLADSGLAVALSTHATGSLDLCDRISVMTPGGQLRFTGTREEVLAHFGEQTIDGVYADVHQEHAPPPAAVMPAESPPPDAELPPLPPLGLQVLTLTARYATCLVRQRRSLAILIGQAPVIGVAIGIALPGASLTGVDLTPFYSLLVAFTLILSSVWLGLISSCREIASEAQILRREAAIGVRVDAYLISKCIVLLPIVAAQVVLLVAPLMLMQPFDGSASAYVNALPICIAVGFTGAMIGLLVSALVRTPGQATAAVPLVIIPQLLLAGALIPHPIMSAPVQLLSDAMPARWALAGVGPAFDLDEHASGSLGTITGHEADFFGIPPGLAMTALIGICVLAFIATTVAITWRLGDDPTAQARD